MVTQVGGKLKESVKVVEYEDVGTFFSETVHSGQDIVNHSQHNLE